jgi:hypothetical protein
MRWLVMSQGRIWGRQVRGAAFRGGSSVKGPRGDLDDWALVGVEHDAYLVGSYRLRIVVVHGEGEGSSRLDKAQAPLAVSRLASSRRARLAVITPARDGRVRR